MKYKLIIFDLDGTLVDTSEGILNSVRYAERKLQLKPLNKKQLKLFLGPPPLEIYKLQYGLSPTMAMNAVKYHREYGLKYAIKESKLYSNVYETLKLLKSREYKLTVATLKLQEIAEKLLKYHNIAQFFDQIVGMNKDETYTKTDLLCLISGGNIRKKDVVLIGDSKYDAIGAENFGIDFIASLYGYGFNEEKQLTQIKKAGTITDFSDLLKL